MQTKPQFISSRLAAQAAAVLNYPAPARQQRQARRVLRAWRQQASRCIAALKRADQ